MHSWHWTPRSRQLDHTAGVHETEAVARAHCEATLVHNVVVRLDGLRSRGEHGEKHDIAPGELWIGLQSQGDYAGGEWRSGRRTCMLRRALVSQVGCDDLVLAATLVTTTVGGSQSGRTLLQVPRLLAPLRCAANTQGVDAVGVAVAGARVIEATAVARGPHVNRAETASASHGAFDEGLLGQRTRTIDHLTVVVGTPRGRVDSDVLGVVAERGGFDRVGDVTVEHANAADARIERHAHRAHRVVGHGGDLARTARAMLVLVGVVVAWHRIVVVSVYVRAGL